MGQYQVERRLTLLYATVIICGIIICACSGIVWNYWKYALDVCPDENCGCILYGKSGISFFIGGHAGYCYWIIYGPLLPIAFSLIMVIFHFIRVYINDFGKYEDEDTRTVEQRYLPKIFLYFYDIDLNCKTFVIKGMEKLS